MHGKSCVTKMRLAQFLVTKLHLAQTNKQVCLRRIKNTFNYFCFKKNFVINKPNIMFETFYKKTIINHALLNKYLK